jgi:DNA-directed RNA polymerase subunit RPC12/RpoP
MNTPGNPPSPERKPMRAFDACPHCGAELSPWEKVLLSVDRALMCRNCWYRIMLDASYEGPDEKERDERTPKGTSS